MQHSKPIHRLHPLILIAIMPSLLAASSFAQIEARWSSKAELSWYLQGIDAEQASRLEQLREAGVMTFDPVALPYGDDLHGNNWHLMHPVAAGDGGRMIVVFGRKLSHYSGTPNPPPDDEHTSEQVFVRSMDGGRTWSPQVDLRRFLKGKPKHRAPGMRAIHHLGGNRLVYVGNVGVLTSDDFGETWEHHPDALGFPDDADGANLGPSIIEHPKHGLVVAAHAWRSGKGMLNETWFWISRDEGLHWRLERVPTTTPSKNIEPAMALVGDRIVFLARSHDPQAHDHDTRTYRYSQGISAPDSLSLRTRFTNIRATDASDQLVTPLAQQGYHESKARAFGYWSQDTVDLILNPVTRRLEAVVTNRMGRSGDNYSDTSRQSLGLWSIDPAELLAGGAWRYEGTLYERHALGAPLFVDGMHPAGSVVDAEHGVEHVFIYLGYYAEASGIYKITRTLDTPRLAAQLRAAAVHSQPDHSP